MSPRTVEVPNHLIDDAATVSPLIAQGYQPLRMKQSAFEPLAKIDWNFTQRTRQNHIEGIHPYPAKFIPEIPATLLDWLPLPSGTVVLDPFVGSGTTLVECQRRGLSSIGVDLNPIACLISRVKTGPLARGIDQALDDVLNFAIGMPKVEIPDIPNLSHWFAVPIQETVARLTTAIRASQPVFQDVLSLALSSILVRVSNQESDTRYAAIEKNVTSASVFAAFASAVRRIEAALTSRDYKLAQARILERDTLSLTAADFSQPIGAIITSPPYPNAYEYWLYHKYRMWWLGHDPLAVKEREIGARAHFFKTSRHTADSFVHQMTRTFEMITAVLVPNGYACFVVGRSKIHGKIVDNASIIETAAESFGFRLAFRAERVIAATRKAFNLSHANIKTETLLVLTR